MKDQITQHGVHYLYLIDFPPYYVQRCLYICPQSQGIHFLIISNEVHGLLLYLSSERLHKTPEKRKKHNCRATLKLREKKSFHYFPPFAFTNSQLLETPARILFK